MHLLKPPRSNPVIAAKTNRKNAIHNIINTCSELMVVFIKITATSAIISNSLITRVALKAIGDDVFAIKPIKNSKSPLNKQQITASVDINTELLSYESRALHRRYFISRMRYL